MVWKVQYDSDNYPVEYESVSDMIADLMHEMLMDDGSLEKWAVAGDYVYFMVESMKHNIDLDNLSPKYREEVIKGAMDDLGDFIDSIKYED